MPKVTKVPERQAFHPQRRLLFNLILDPILSVSMAILSVLLIVSLVQPFISRAITASSFLLIGAAGVVVGCVVRNFMYWQTLDSFLMDEEPAVYVSAGIFVLVSTFASSLLSFGLIGLMLPSSLPWMRFLGAVIVSLVIVALQIIPALMRRNFLQRIEDQSVRVNMTKQVTQAVEVFIRPSEEKLVAKATRILALIGTLISIGTGIIEISKLLGIIPE